MYFVVPSSSINSLSVESTVIPVPSVAPSICTAEPDTLSAVVIVSNLVSTIAALELISALTILSDKDNLE